MHEQQHPPESEKEQVVSLLKRFNSDLHMIEYDAGVYGNDLADSCEVVKDRFKQYIAGELAITEQSSEAFFGQLQQEGVLPSDNIFQNDPLAGIEAYRLAVYKAVMPIYQNMHTEREYRQWLTTAMYVVVPKEGRHDAEVCLRTNGPTDTSCEIGECPVRTMASDTTNEFVKPDFETYDYILDPKKAYRNRHALLGLVVWRHFIPETEKRQLESCYDRQFSAFGFPETSQ